MKSPEKNLPYPLDIQLAVDGSEHSVAATSWIADLSLPAGSKVTALGVLAPRQSPGRAALLAALDEVKVHLLPKGIQVNTGLLHGHPAEALIDFADEHRPDLMVVGAKGLHATLGILLGGVAQQIVEHASWPVAVVRTPYSGLRRVLLATDGSPNSQSAVEYLAKFPLPDKTEVLVIHVMLPPQVPMLPRSGANLDEPEYWEAYERAPEIQKKEARAVLSEALKVLRSSGIRAKSVLASGSVAEEIIQYVDSQEIDQVVAGSRGLSAVKGWLLGSVSRKLIYHCKCSVLIIPDQMGG